MTLTERAVTFSSKLRQELDGLVPFEFRGRVLQVTGTIIKAYAPGAKIGELCSLLDPTHEQSLLTEVVGFENDLALLTPLGEIRGVSSYTEVIPLGRTHEVPVGQQLLGRVLDGLGQPSDGLGDIRPEAFYPVLADP